MQTKACTMLLAVLPGLLSIALFVATLSLKPVEHAPPCCRRLPGRAEY
jgi:hypothetical protein